MIILTVFTGRLPAEIQGEVIAVLREALERIGRRIDPQSRVMNPKPTHEGLIAQAALARVDALTRQAGMEK